MDELRRERNEAQARVRQQGRVLERLYADRTDDHRLLARQIEWLQEYTTRLGAAEEELARLRAALDTKEMAMHMTEVRMEEVINLGNYNSRRLGVTLVLDPGDAPEAAFEAARRVIRDQARAIQRANAVEAAQAVLAVAEQHHRFDVERARQTLREYGVPLPPAPPPAVPPVAPEDASAAEDDMQF